MIMSTHKYSAVNPLLNPVCMDDIIIAASGERYQVKQNMRGEFWLRHIRDGFDLTHAESGQVAICRQIDQLANI